MMLKYFRRKQSLGSVFLVKNNFEKPMKKKIVQIVLFIVMLTMGMFLNAQKASAKGVIDLPKTGQTKCYNTDGKEISCKGTGQDGEIRAGDHDRHLFAEFAGQYKKSPQRTGGLKMSHPLNSPTEKTSETRRGLSTLARLKGFEPLTHCLEGSCSILLSYRRIP
jgi:hypothetical protein